MMTSNLQTPTYSMKLCIQTNLHTKTKPHPKTPARVPQSILRLSSPPAMASKRSFTDELKKKGDDFDPNSAATWKGCDHVPFLFLARAFELISNESDRIVITNILANVFRTVIATTPGDLLATVYLSANRIHPPHKGIEPGIGNTSLIKAMAEAYGRSVKHVQTQLLELGDLGIVAKANSSSQKVMFKPQPLTIDKVLKTFREIAEESGKDSRDRKRNHIKVLLVAATDCEPQYIIRLLQSKMRICLAEKTVLVALGQAALHSETLPHPPSNIQSPLEEHLYSSFEELPGEFQFATAITSNDLEEIQKFLCNAFNASCEGLIIKTLDKDATYEPSMRSNNWLKLKKDYMDSVGDSLDLVPIAAFHGRGKRTGVFGSFLLACYDEENDEFQTICKIGTGFSELQLEERSQSLRGKIIPKPKPYYRYADSMNPDVWFEPAEVWEVKAADLSISPVHRAACGVVDSNKGISLRFPRLQRVRYDKSPDQATTSDEVADMYRAQKINHTNNQEEEDGD